MTTINILCLGCNKSFEFEHPSVKDSSGLDRVTITCPTCEKPIVRAEIHAVMEPIETKTKRRLSLEGLRKPPANVINLPRSPLSDSESLKRLKDQLNRSTGTE